ncbi:response regulator [Dawidia soli]|uniref:Response regulator transcription factor n=1 Tax=Dawidia soli TaxID=2782352 RepID=A0AAP2DGU3_9BACT|nr:response regulator transcription factor [Dawidia soli]MBT1690821.1 response regulator transcription factor [Dawidia soli]
MDTINLAVVEDVLEIREGLKFLLNQGKDFSCPFVYASAEDALVGLLQHPPDVVVMDISLPGMSGIECMRQVKAVRPEIQFLMFTVYEDSEQIFLALSSGANGYLLKNASPDKIVEAIRELHGGGAPMSAAIARKVVGSFRPAEVVPGSSSLSAREREVLDYLAKGLLYKEIGDKLGISTGTVRQHIHHIYRKLHVQNRTEALNKAFGTR